MRRLFISIATLVILFDWKKPEKAPQWKDLLKSEYWYPAILFGLLLGFAFSIKYTTIFLFAGAIGYLSHHYGKLLFIAWNLIFLGFIFLSGFYHWGNLPISGDEAIMFGGLIGGIGLIAAVYHFWQHRSRFVPWILSLVVVGASFAFVFAPWATKHLMESDKGLTISSLLYGKPDRIAITVQPELLSSRFNRPPGFDGAERSWVQLTQNEQQSPPVEPSAEEEDNDELQELLGSVQREELQRYLGYEEGIWRYLTIPFDLTANTNVAGLRHQEIGFFWLALIPLLFLGFGLRLGWVRTLGAGLTMTFLLTAWVWSLTETGPQEGYFEAATEYQRSLYGFYPDWLNSEFYYFWQSLQSPLIHIGEVFSSVFTAIAAWPTTLFLSLLLALFVGLVKLLKWRYQEWPKALYGIGLFLFAYVLLWALLGNSISWYAMLTWILIPAILIYYLQKPELFFGEGYSRLIKYIFGTALVLQLLANTLVVLSSSQLGQPKAQLFNWPMVSFLTSGDLDHFETLSLFDRYSSEISSIVNRDPSARIYRINTYLQYHIERNNERVFEDNQLDRFARILSITEQPDSFLDVLSDNDFEYVLYDLNTYTLDQTPEQTLRRKCERFLNLMVSTGKAELILTDNFVAAPNAQAPTRLPNGQMAQAQPGLIGNTVYNGRVALFRIK